MLNDEAVGLNYLIKGDAALKMDNMKAESDFDSSNKSDILKAS